MSKTYVGFGRYDITPEEYGPMAGLGGDGGRIASIVLDQLFGTCVAFRDEAGESFVLCTFDLLHPYKEHVTDALRERLSKATGIAPERFMICATHNHAGPTCSSPWDPRIAAFLERFYKQMTKAALEAIEDLAEAEIYVGSKHVENMNFTRHYITNDGMPFGTGLGSSKTGFKSHLCPADDLLQLMRFKRKDRRDIVLVNWGAHVTIVGATYADTQISADYPGAMRTHIEGMTGCHVAFFQSAAGNVGTYSRIEELNRIKDKKDFRAYGRTLAEEAMQIIDDLAPVKSGPVRVKKLIKQIPIDHSQDHLAEHAAEALRLYEEAEGMEPRERVQILRDRGYRHDTHALMITRRSQMDAHDEMELNALCAGDISFVTAPYEMFASNGRFIKDNTPFPMTFVISDSNNTQGYIPDKQGCQYLTYEYTNRFYPAGTGEELADTFVDMLKEIKE